MQSIIDGPYGLSQRVRLLPNGCGRAWSEVWIEVDHGEDAATSIGDDQGVHVEVLAGDFSFNDGLPHSFLGVGRAAAKSRNSIPTRS